jgi:hypothetical protein
VRCSCQLYYICDDAHVITPGAHTLFRRFDRAESELKLNAEPSANLLGMKSAIK